MTATDLLNLPPIKINPITSKDSVRRFDCGEREVNTFFQRKAFKSAQQGRTKIFIATKEANQLAIGAYSLTVSREQSQKLATQDQKDIWSDGVPLIFIGYIGVHRSFQNMGLGRLLLIDALKRANSVSKDVPFYGVGLRSLNDRTTTFYKRMGFNIAPGEDNQPLMIIDIWSINSLFSPSQ